MLLRTYAQRLAPLLHIGQQRTPFRMTELMMRNAFGYQYDKAERPIDRWNRVVLCEGPFVEKRRRLLCTLCPYSYCSNEMKFCHNIQPHVVPNLYDFLFSAEHKEDILNNNDNQTFFLINTKGVKRTRISFTTNILKISSFVFSRRKKVIQVWNDMRLNTFILFFLLLLLNYPFKIN